MAAYTDGALLVVRSGQTHRTGLRGALEALKYTGRPVIGTVLNDLRPGVLSRYTSYGYYYSGYYGKQYTMADGHAAGEPHLEPLPSPRPLESAAMVVPAKERAS
jgi:Mrp family chromosome partitioning ATPase